MPPESGDRPFTAREVQETAGLTYRQLNDWDARGALPPDDARGNKWRRFSPRDLFVLMVCAELRKRFGVPVERLKVVRQVMLAEDADHLSEAARLMARLDTGVWLIADFDETFIMASEVDLDILVQQGLLRGEGQAGYVFLRVNPLVNRILSALKDPVVLPKHGRGYEILRLMREQMGVRSAEEFEVLQLIRSGEFASVEVVLVNGKVERIGTTKRPGTTARLGALIREHEYQKITLTTSGGRVVSLEQEATRRVGHATRK